MRPSLLGIAIVVLIPVLAMVTGFLVAARIVLRGRDLTDRGFTAAGDRIMLGEPHARLIRASGVPGLAENGALLLTAGALVFERYFPARERRLVLDDALTASVGTAPGGTAILRVRADARPGSGGEEWEVKVADPPAWAEAIRRAVAAPREAVEAAAPSPPRGARR